VAFTDFSVSTVCSAFQLTMWKTGL